MFLLNKLPCLDKGFVGLISSTNDSNRLRDVLPYLSIKNSMSELDLSYMTLLIKCPLFVQLHLSQFNLLIFNTTMQLELETYIPNEAEVNASDLETSRLISDDIKRTADALQINPSAYKADGCDNFISQVLTPINTYTTIVVHGSRKNWQNFINQNILPKPIEAYRNTIQQIYNAEWINEKKEN